MSPKDMYDLSGIASSHSNADLIAHSPRIYSVIALAAIGQASW